MFVAILFLNFGVWGSSYKKNCPVFGLIWHQVSEDDSDSFHFLWEKRRLILDGRMVSGQSM